MKSNEAILKIILATIKTKLQQQLKNIIAVIDVTMRNILNLQQSFTITTSNFIYNEAEKPHVKHGLWNTFEHIENTLMNLYNLIIWKE